MPGGHDVADQALPGLARAVLDDRDLGQLREALRAACLEYIEKNWTGMRPKSLIEARGG